jgi:nicotinamidase
VDELLAKKSWDVIVATKDWHPSNHISFASNNPGTKPFELVTFQHPDKPGETKSTPVWPDHCVQNSFGSEFPGELKNISRIKYIIKKGTIPNREFYSGFNDIWGSSDTELKATLKQYDITDIYVVGLALDYCVFHTAVGASQRGFRTFVLKQATKPVVPDNTEATYKDLRAHSVSALDIDELSF